MSLTFGSLFAGIGGLDLGLERAGMVCKWQVEIDAYASKVLEKHWPNVPRFKDVREFPAWTDYDLRVDLICGGFPCQDISQMGHRTGLAGERSGLWSEYIRVVRAIRPRYVLVENVSALRFRGLDTVLRDLADSGFDAEWDCIPAAAVGAPHIRDRIWLLAYSRQKPVANLRKSRERRGFLLQQRADGPTRKRSEDRELVTLVSGIHPRISEDWWRSQSLVDRTANGISRQLDRLGCGGNAVVPQVAQWIGERILEAEGLKK